MSDMLDPEIQEEIDRIHVEKERQRFRANELQEKLERVLRHLADALRCPACRAAEGALHHDGCVVMDASKEIAQLRERLEDHKRDHETMKKVWKGREREAITLKEQAEKALRQAAKVKDGAYSERNKLVAALSKLFPASLERHPEDDKTWEDDWRWIVFVDLPTGQASWHLHDSELPQFEHLPRGAGRKWDGHSNDEKYARLAALALPVPQVEEKK